MIPRLLVASLLLSSLAGCVAAPEPVAPVAAGEPALVCGAPCEVAVDDGPLDAFEPAVAASPLEPLRLVAVQSEVDEERRRWFVVYTSDDGGATWTASPVFGGRGQLPAGHPLALCTDLVDPVVAVAPDGAVVVAGLAGDFRSVPLPFFGGLPASTTSIFVARSADHGATFPEVTVVTDGRGIQPSCASAAAPAEPPRVPFDFVDKPAVAAGPDGLVLLAWKRASEGVDPFAGELAAALSRDGGRTFEHLAPNLGSDAAFPYGAALAFGSAGEMYAAYVDPGFQHPDEENDLWFSRSVDQGATWEAQKIGKTVLSYPSLAVHATPAGDRLAVAFATITGVEHQTPALVLSDDGGLAWSERILLDAPEAPTIVMPTVAFDGAGRAYSGFYHGLGDGESNDYRVAAVADGAVVGPVVVSAAPIGRQTMGFTSGLGHYMGMAPLPDGALALWVSGEAGSGSDLRSARVRLA